MKANRITFTSWLIFFIFLAVLLLTYATVLVTPYAFSDDYTFLSDVLIQGGHKTITVLIGAGRPITGFLLAFFFAQSPDIAGLRYIRVITVFGIVLLAWCLYRACVAAKWPVEQAAFLALTICTLSPFQVYAAWTQYFPIPFAAVFAGGAARLAQLAFDAAKFSRKVMFTLLGVLLMLLALTIYQPAAMFFWVFVAITLFRAKSMPGNTLRRLIWYTAIATIALCLAFLIFKLGVTLYPPGNHNREGLTHNIAEKLSWFLEEPLSQALYLSDLSALRWTFFSKRSMMVTIFITTGLLLHFNSKPRQRLLMLGIALTLIPFAYLPNLIVTENWSSYRTQSALTSLIAVYAFLALRGFWQTFCQSTLVGVLRSRLKPVVSDIRVIQYSKLGVARYTLSALLGLVALTSSFRAAHNVSNYFAWPQMLEIKLMQSQLVGHDLASIKAISVLQPRFSDSVSPQVHYDEFGLASSAQSWSPKPMIQLLLHQMNPLYTEIPIKVIAPDEHSKPTTLLPKELLVDMQRLQGFRWYIKP